MTSALPHLVLWCCADFLYLLKNIYIVSLPSSLSFLLMRIYFSIFSNVVTMFFPHCKCLCISPHCIRPFFPFILLLVFWGVLTAFDWPYFNLPHVAWKRTAHYCDCFVVSARFCVSGRTFVGPPLWFIALEINKYSTSSMIRPSKIRPLNDLASFGLKVVVPKTSFFFEN